MRILPKLASHTKLASQRGMGVLTVMSECESALPELQIVGGGIIKAEKFPDPLSASVDRFDSFHYPWIDKGPTQVVPSLISFFHSCIADRL